MNPDPVNKFLNDPIFSIKYFDPEYWFGRESEVGEALYQGLFSQNTWDLIKFIFALLAIFFVFVICYTVVRMLEIRRKEHEHLHHEIAEYAHHQKEKEKHLAQETNVKNEKWRSVIEHLSMPDLSEWKMAVLEADEILFDLFEALGFDGENMGEKLRNLPIDKFRNLAIAWEAHAFRNRIAHEGGFAFSQSEAKRIVGFYEQIFRDYDFI